MEATQILMSEHRVIERVIASLETQADKLAAPTSDAPRSDSEVPMPNGDAGPVTVLPPDDLLLLQFHFHGLKLQQPQTAGQPWLRVKNPPGQAKPLIIVECPPQSIDEEAFFETVVGVPALTGQRHPIRPISPRAKAS